jgi:four helix bundle protein
MSNKAPSPNVKRIYDLPERTARFGEAVIRFAKSLPNTLVVRPLVSQVVRSSTSIGANYMEADGAGSARDFTHKIVISRKEAKETMHWLRMIAAADESQRAECRRLWQEAHELALILSKIAAGKKS